jgi:CHAD domain-containing protein
MEIEAKFTIPDRETFDQLCQLKELAGYRLEPAGVKHVHDRYLDTPDRAILSAGYACRVRRKRIEAGLASAVATLKGLGGAEVDSGIHRRTEYEVAVDDDAPTSWPESPARDLVLQLSAGQRLRELFSLDQARHLRLLYDDVAEGGRQVAELSLDVVTPGCRGSLASYHELEIELRDQGNESDLQALASELRTIWGLRPEPRSKFARGLELVDGVAPGDRWEKSMDEPLTADERTALQSWVESRRPAQQRRARIILLSEEGQSTSAIAAEVGLSGRQVRRWLAAFRENRMGIFPTDVESAQPEADMRTLERPGAPDEPEPVMQAFTEAETEPVPVRGSVLDADVLPELTAPGVVPDDPMSEAGRKTLWFHFLRMLKHEPGTRAGADIEELHDMRVATRRMRAAIRVFGDFYQPKVIAPFNKGLRRVARALGPVRDLDVFEEKAKRYLKSLPKEARGGLDPLLDAWRQERETARKRMISFLDSQRNHKFKLSFGDFLQTDGTGARSVRPGQPVPYQVRHVAPRLVYTRYEAVRAYETVLEDAQIETLHALRIDCKYLRYTLEFLREVMDPEVEAVIEEIKAMQDHLGDLNDAEVAIDLLSEFLGDWDAAQANVPLTRRRSAEGVVTYLAAQHAEKHRLLTTFPEAWARLNREEVRRWMALAVAAL